MKLFSEIEAGTYHESNDKQSTANPMRPLPSSPSPLKPSSPIMYTAPSPASAPLSTQASDASPASLSRAASVPCSFLEGT